MGTSGGLTSAKGISEHSTLTGLVVVTFAGIPTKDICFSLLTVALDTKGNTNSFSMLSETIVGNKNETYNCYVPNKSLGGKPWKSLAISFIFGLLTVEIF